MVEEKCVYGFGGRTYRKEQLGRPGLDGRVKVR